MSIYIALAIVLCNMVPFRASKVLITLFAIELGAEQLYIGVLVALYSLFPMLLALYAGRLADRLGMRLPIVAGSLGIGMGLLLPSLASTMTALYASATLIGAGQVFYNVSIQNLIGRIGVDGDRTRNFTNFGLAMAMAGLIGPLAAGFAIDHLGHGRSYLYFAGVPLFSVMIALAARGMPQTLRARPGSGGRASGSRDLLANTPLRRALIASAVLMVGTDLFQFYMPIYGHAAGLTASQIGIVLSLFAAAAFAVRLLMPALLRRWSAEQVLLSSLFMGSLAYLLLPWFASVVLLSALAFVLGLGMGCGQPLTLALIHERAPEGRTGEALGLRLTVNNFMHIAVPLTFGAMGTALGVAPVFLANAVILACGGFVMRRQGAVR
jgi:MFS family permease